MKIGEITRSSNNIALQARVVDKGEKREVNTKYGRKSVADCVLEDESGQITLSLWEEKIDQVRVGDVLTIEGGYVTEFRDKMQLNLPRSGKMEISSQ
ncbi:MAG: DNA-binding protein [Candidatus Aenigmarchaeota archaeon]|nr:DNA-binding protein [Candidatus Aenigmarchaeota archaeon]